MMGVLMSNGKLRVTLALLGAIALAGGGNAAQASLWDATYDPPEFVGTAVFNVPDACLSVTDGLHTGGCGIQVTSNVTTAPFAINFAATLPSTDVLSYVVVGGQLVGVETGIIGPVDVSETDYWFQFLTSFNNNAVSNVANLYTDCSDNECSTTAQTTSGVTFARQTTPEPGSIGLILGAFGAGWLARRRKAAA
jgi:hypothetical protein